MHFEPVLKGFSAQQRITFPTKGQNVQAELRSLRQDLAEMGAGRNRMRSTPRICRMPQAFWSRASTTLDPMLVLAEVEHRIANEFALAISSINLIARTCNGDARNALERAAVRLHHYALAHRALLPPISADSLDLSKYLNNVCHALTRANLTDRGITLTLQEKPITIEAWRAWRIGLILSELISNSLRHSLWPTGGGVIRVELAASDFNIQCRVIDNGQAIKVPSIGNGTHILDGLVAEMCANIHRKFSDQGAMIVVTLPRFHPVDPGLHTSVGQARHALYAKRLTHDV